MSSLLMSALRYLIFACLFKNHYARLNSGNIAMSSSSRFPTVLDAMEVVMLSNLVYGMKNCEPNDLPPEFPSYLRCEFYEEKSNDGTQVAVVRSDEKKYVAVVYAGTDSAIDVLYDTDLEAVRFGPKHDYLVENKHVKVYGGFNEQVFGDGLYARLLALVSDMILNQYPSYRLIVTGHSLGGANSILTSVAFAIALSPYNHVFVENINVASPRTGTEAFRKYANSLENLSIWRLVLKNDIVPRLPPSMYFWKHPGHTIQMNTNKILCYYLHYGDKVLEYAGVPFPWNDVPFLDPITGSLHHLIKAYIDYIQTRNQTINNETSFVISFVSTKDQLLGVQYDEWSYYNSEDESHNIELTINE